MLKNLRPQDWVMLGGTSMTIFPPNHRAERKKKKKKKKKTPHPPPPPKDPKKTPTTESFPSLLLAFPLFSCLLLRSRTGRRGMTTISIFPLAAGRDPAFPSNAVVRLRKPGLATRATISCGVVVVYEKTVHLDWTVLNSGRLLTPTRKRDSSRRRSGLFWLRQNRDRKQTVVLTESVSDPECSLQVPLQSLRRMRSRMTMMFCSQPKRRVRQESILRCIAMFLGVSINDPQ